MIMLCLSIGRVVNCFALFWYFYCLQYIYDLSNFDLIIGSNLFYASESCESGLIEGFLSVYDSVI